MNKLLTTAAVALTLGLSTISFADANVFGVDVPVKKNQVRSQVKGSYVESDHISFYLNSVDRKENRSSENKKQKFSAEEGYNVFGVKINV